MNIESYREYCLTHRGATESIPFNKAPDILVFKIMGKMFSATDISTFDSFSIKCNPDTVEELRAQYPSLQEPSYLNKKHWSKVIMDGSIPDSLLKVWITNSYELVIANMTKKMQQELSNQFGIKAP